MLLSTSHRRQTIHALLAACALLLTPGKLTVAADPIHATASTSQPAEIELALKKREVDLRERELELKKEELEFKRQEAARLQTIEEWKTLASTASVLVAAIALGIPVWIAAINVRAQRKASDEQAKLTFQMKVADLALQNAENAYQAKERARALASLFDHSPLLPKGFAERFDPKNFKLNFGHSGKMRQEALAPLAQYPSQRAQILKDWYVLLQADSWWVEPLLAADPNEEQKLEQMRRRLKDNERRVNEENAARKQQT